MSNNELAWVEETMTLIRDAEYRRALLLSKIAKMQEEMNRLNQNIEVAQLLVQQRQGSQISILATEE